MNLLTYYQQTNYPLKTNEQTKVIQEIVSSEVSKLNHAVMNKKQGDQMQFSKTRKKKMDSSNPSYQSMHCIMKWRNRFISSIRIFFICFKILIMQ